jgi:hypothetical protein
VTVFSPPPSTPVTFSSSGSSSGSSGSVTMDCVGGTSNAATFEIQ